MNTGHDTPSQDAPPSAPHEPPGPQRSRQDIRDLSRIRRTVGTQRNIAGVCGGLAKHFDVDPLIVRVVFVVLIFFGGAGLVAYGAAWLLVPDETGQRAIFPVDDRSRTFALAVVGGIAALLIIGDSWGGFGFPWPLAIIGLLVALLVIKSQRRDTGQQPAAPVSLSKDEPAAYSAGPQQSAPLAGAAQPWNDRGRPVSRPLAPPPPPAPPGRSRKAGPILFLWTLALMALAIGTVGILDLAGFDVPDSAYPATILAISGLMLLVGAFYGRAGGIILVGLVAAVVAAGASITDNWDPQDTRYVPTSAADVRDRYSIETGRLVVDLSEVSDPAELAGRTIDISADLGQIIVILPDRLDVDWHASVDAGNVIRPGKLGEFGGIDFTDDGTYDVPADLGLVKLDTSVDLGAIEFRTAA